MVQTYADDIYIPPGTILVCSCEMYRTPSTPLDDLGSIPDRQQAITRILSSFPCKDHLAVPFLLRSGIGKLAMGALTAYVTLCK